MAVSISKRAFRSLNATLSPFTALSNGLNSHRVVAHNVSSLQPSTHLGNVLSSIARRRFSATILTSGSSEDGFPADLLSRKTRAIPPERTLGLYQDLVIPVTNLSNEDKGLIVLAGDVFDVPIRKDIIHRVVRWQLAKRQQGTHSTKTKSEVSGSGRKPWNQKGTGRARTGSRRSAQWRGGETKHGPKPRSHAFKLNKKVRRLGLKIALSAYAAEGKLLAFDDMDVSSHKTKNIAHYHKQMLEMEESKKVKEPTVVEEACKKVKKLLLVDGDINENLKLATQNLHYVNVLPVGGLNVHSILLHDTIAMSRDAINKIVERMHTPINRNGQASSSTEMLK